MRQRAVLVLTLLLLLAAGAVPALATGACTPGTPNCRCEAVNGAIRCVLVNDHRPPRDDDDDDAPVDPRVAVTYPVIDTSQAPPCVRQRTVLVLPEDAQDTLYWAHRGFFFTYEHMVDTAALTDCAGENVAFTISRAVRAQLFQALPPFTPVTNPSKAIVGKELFLDTGAQMTWNAGSPATWTVTDPITGQSYAISLWGESDLVVDWGDGSPTTTSTSPGGPWPHGDLRHVYTTRADPVVITVEQRWDIHWTFGGNSGTIFDLSTGTRPTSPFRVWELQPVRES